MTDDTKLDLTTHSLPADKTADLLRLFPEIRADGGKIDFEKLKLVLGETVDIGREPNKKKDELLDEISRRLEQSTKTEVLFATKWSLS